MANGNDNDDDGNDQRNTATGKRPRNRRASNSDATIGIVGSDNDSTDGENSIAGNGDESATRESRKGDAIPLFASVRDDGTGTGNRSNNPGGTGNRADGSATGTEEIEIRIDGAVPRKVKSSELGSAPRKGKSDVSPEFLAECWQLMFGGVASFVKDSEWKIDDDDASELGTRTAKLINSLDPKKSGKWIKTFQKHQPALSLAFAVAMIASPRIKHTRDKRKNGRIQSQAESGNAGNRATGSPIQNDGSAHAGLGDAGNAGIAANPERDTNTGIAGIVGVPVSKQDAASIISRSKSGKM